MYNKYELENSEKKRIFDIAMNIMEEVGYEGLTIRALCAKADISTGKFYSYFQSKIDLLCYYFDGAIEAVNHEIENVENWDTLDIKEQIVSFYTWYTAYTENMGLEFVMHFFSNDNQIFNFSSYNNDIVRLTETYIQKAVQKGYVVPDDKSIHDIACDLCVVVKGCIFHWCLQRGAFSLPEYTKDLLTRCVRGLL
ncbi:MAG: TetR/AcrR family transcriptional regulator [Lachnospiraceae bacterium]